MFNNRAMRRFIIREEGVEKGKEGWEMERKRVNVGGIVKGGYEA